MVLQFGMTATSSTRLRVKTGKIPKMDVCAGLLQLPTACTGGCTTIAIISSSMTKHTLKRTGPCPSLPDRPMNLTGCWEKTCSHSLGSPAETHQVTPHSASTGLLPDLGSGIPYRNTEVANNFKGFFRQVFSMSDVIATTEKPLTKKKFNTLLKRHSEPTQR